MEVTPTADIFTLLGRDESNRTLIDHRQEILLRKEQRITSESFLGCRDEHERNWTKIDRARREKRWRMRGSIKPVFSNRVLSKSGGLTKVQEKKCQLKHRYGVNLIFLQLEPTLLLGWDSPNRRGLGRYDFPEHLA